MKILIIGGTGFIGRHLIPELADRHELILLHRGNQPIDARFRSICMDRQALRGQRAAFAALRLDVVIDLIPYVAQEAWDLVHTFSGICPRVILLSSGDVYRSYEVFKNNSGPVDNSPAREADELRHQLFPYRGTDRDNSLLENYDKILVEQVVRAQRALDYTILRLGAVYGPHDGQNKLGEYLTPMLTGADRLTLDAAKADWRWTRVFVREVARAIRLAVEPASAARNEIFNVGEPAALTQLELAQQLKELTGWSGEIVREPRRGKENFNYDQDVVLDTRKIRQQLGYTEQYSRADGLRETIAYARKPTNTQL